jgi:hypothetical protein
MQTGCFGRHDAIARFYGVQSDEHETIGRAFTALGTGRALSWQGAISSEPRKRSLNISGGWMT